MTYTFQLTKPIKNRFAKISEWVIYQLPKLEVGGMYSGVYEVSYMKIIPIWRQNTAIGKMFFELLFEAQRNENGNKSYISEALKQTNQNVTAEARSTLYTFNKSVFAELTEYINPTFEDFVKKDELQQLESLDFEYKEIDNRLYNPLQNLPRKTRAGVFKKAGLDVDIDIKSAITCLTYNYAKSIGYVSKNRAIEQFIANPDAYREHIRKNYTGFEKVIKNGQKKDPAKQLITAIVNGMKQTQFSGYTTQERAKVNGYEVYVRTRFNFDFPTYFQNPFEMDKFLNDEYLQNVFVEIAEIWKYIAADERKNGNEVSSSANSRWRILFYFQLEKKVMDIVCEYIKNKGGKVFRIHDGCLTNVDVTKSELSKLFGGDIKFSIEYV